MTIVLQIPDRLANELERVAKSRGRSAEEVALAAIQKELEPFARLDELMAPTYAAMQSAGISKDEAVEEIEQLKHDLRRERRAGGFNRPQPTIES
jgi:hypothetical protein